MSEPRGIITKYTKLKGYLPYSRSSHVRAEGDNYKTHKNQKSSAPTPDPRISEPWEITIKHIKIRSAVFIPAAVVMY